MINKVCPVPNGVSTKIEGLSCSIISKFLGVNSNTFLASNPLIHEILKPM